MDQQLKKMFNDIEYYFFRLPYYSLWRPDRAYRKIKAFSVNRMEEDRRARVAQNLKRMFGESLDDGRIEILSQKYFEVLCCDDIDAWLRLIRPWHKIKEAIKVEDEGNLSEVIKEGKGCILLSAHFGGAFFIFDIVRELGGRPQMLVRPIKWNYFRGNFFRWVYFKFRIFCMERAIGEKMIFSEGKETRKELLVRLEKGYHLVVTFDVPPHFTKGDIQKVTLLGRDWYFPRGFLEVVAGREIPIVPFFTYLDEDYVRTFRFYPAYQIRNRDETSSVFQECVRIFESHLLKTPGQWFFWDGAEVFWKDPHSTDR